MTEYVWTPKSRENLCPETIRIIGKVLDEIPQLPVSVQKIIEMATDTNIGAKELAEVASTDPVLSSKILTMINSAYYGLNRKIDNIRVAIVLLGFDMIRSIAIQNRFLRVLDEVGEVGLYNREDLWVHSYLVSVSAEALISDEDPLRKGVLVTMGILHDIGKFALYAIGMMMMEKGITSPALYDISPDTPLLKREELLFGVNHTIVGSMLASKWNLSERICAALEYHHYPSFFAIDEVPPEYLEDITIISLADLIVNQFMGENTQLPEPHHTYFNLLGINPPVENLLTDEHKSKLSKSRKFVQSLA